MVNKTTASQLYIQRPQCVVEATEGVTPIASPNFNTLGEIGINTALSIKVDGNWIDVAQIGSEQLASIIQGLNTYEIQIKFAITGTTKEIDYIKRFCNAANYTTPAGTVSETVSIILSIPLNGVEQFIIGKGMRPNNFTYTRESGKADEFAVDFKGTFITSPAAHGLTTPVFATRITGTVLGYTSGGLNPLVYSSGTNSALDNRRFSFSVNRNVNEDYVDQADPHSTQPHGWRIAGDFENLWTGVLIGAAAKSIETDCKEGSKRNIVFTLQSAPSNTITFTNANVKTYNRDSGAEDSNALAEAAGFGCPTVVVA